MRPDAVIVALLAVVPFGAGAFIGCAGDAEMVSFPLPATGASAATLINTSALFGFFTENAGQLGNPSVRYYASAGGLQVGFAESAVLFNLVERPPSDGADAVPLADGRSVPTEARAARGVLVRMSFEGANPVLPQARGELPQRSHYFLGIDPARWRADVRSYREVMYENLYEGIDVVYRLDAEGPKYDILVHPGADLASIRMRYEGVEEVRIEREQLVIRTALGDLREATPVAHQDGVAVSCSFTLPRVSAGFSCSWDEARLLVIDPLLYATFLGGSGSDGANSLVLDAAGNVYVAGSTFSTDFPATPGAYGSANSGSGDAFVAELDAANGSLIYATYLGGSNSDEAYSLGLDVGGNISVAGRTYSMDFPVTPGAYDATYGGLGDSFLARISATGGILVYSTYLGGSNNDEVYSLALDVAGNATVAGRTYSTDFPATPGAYDTTYDGAEDAFVSKLDVSGGALVYATFLGGSGTDRASTLVLDGSGGAIIAGFTGSTDFPATPGAYDATYNGGWDAFVAKLNASGGTLIYATFLGGNSLDDAQSLALDPAGNVYMAGYTWSIDFPATPGAYDTTLNGNADTFVAELDAAGNAMKFATLIGGSWGDYVKALAIDATGDVYIAGFTNSTDFPTTPDAYDATSNGNGDAFVAKVEAAGSILANGSYLGGSEFDGAYSLALDPAGNIYVAGVTGSPDFPATPGAYDATLGGIQDAFVTKLNLSPDGTPPVVVITSPAGGTWFKTDEVQIFGSASDAGWGLGRVEISCDAGAAWATATGTSSWGYLCTSLAEGVHVVHARAFDLNGLESIHDTVTVNVDLTPPSPPALTRADLAGGAFEDLRLTWDPSPEEGLPGRTGAYRVLGALGNPAGPYTSVAVLIANGFASYNFTCAGCGHSIFDPTLTFFMVQSVDLAGNTADSNLAAKYARAVSGHTLLAVPVAVSDDSVSTVLQTVGSELVVAWRHDASDGPDPWKSYGAAKGGGDLTALPFGSAFWLRTIVPAVYTVAGLVVSNPAIPLRPGWNLVAYAALASEPVAVSLAGVAGVARVETFDTSPPYDLGIVAPTELLAWGEGYWVYTTVGGQWTQG